MLSDGAMDSTQQARIFVADHPVDDRAWASVAMHGLGSVMQWQSGERLLGDVLSNTLPDLLFIADPLPDVRGLDICRRLARDPVTRALPVVMLSADTSEAYVRTALEAGAIDVLQKPLNPDLLRVRIRSYLALGEQAQSLSFEARTRSEELERMVQTMRTELAEREQTMARAEFLFSHDLITGLPNRRHMLELLERVRRRAANQNLPMALVGVCLDHFGALQASIAKETFDRLLVSIGGCIQHALRPMDFVARVSEDLFAAVLVPGNAETAETAARHARDVAARAARALQEDLHMEGRIRGLQVRTSISVYPEDGRRANELLNHLESTLQLTRDTNPMRDRRGTTPDLASALSLELRLRRAMESDRLVPYYQPKLDARSGKLLGGEALIRWPLRNGEYVGPGEFVPVAEAGGLSPALDDYVLTAACCQIAEWQDRFEHFRVAVNLSALKLHHRGIFDRLRELFATTRARAEHLELEITEGALITDFDAAANWLRAVREMGVTVALDDFGTGYSSLAYLRRLPLDAIKIDQSFVTGLEEDRSNVAIVRAMIAMAKALDLRVVAEGVETAKQADILTRLGCDALQGFLYSAAVPARIFETMLQEGRVAPRVPVPAVGSGPTLVVSNDGVRGGQTASSREVLPRAG
ncbi:putative bifunctional diguanylate cyclase/phosphodiesterase [Panacagrimonas sp.]|uniref:putative bifunctional diguanylate cyclase/phosphodiesterase n=1 Tax=Panacagrimonas sp. TaxID=2480088 RepID=UPI003B51CF42